jgi:hypothetical protein
MWRMSLCSPSHVSCQSSPSTHVTPVTKQLDSIVRKIAPVWGSMLWIFRSRYCPTQSVPSAHVRPEPRPLQAPEGSRRPLPSRSRLFECDGRRADRSSARRTPCRRRTRRRWRARPGHSTDRTRGARRLRRTRRGCRRNAVHVRSIRKRAVFADNLGCLYAGRCVAAYCSTHVLSLSVRCDPLSLDRAARGVTTSSRIHRSVRRASGALGRDRACALCRTLRGH